MKLNGTIFSSPQQDQLKRGIGAELGKIAAKVDDVDKRMLNYMGDWATGNEYHENDVVTWAHDGYLYEVIKAHTSSATFDPDNPEYYKAMTATKVKKYTVSNPTDIAQLQALAQFVNDNIGRINAIYGILADGSRTALSYRVNATNEHPYLLLTSGATLIGNSKEIQIRQIEKIDNTQYNRWISLTGQSDNSVIYTNNGSSNFASIEVYYF